jgi:hypothetical protein
MFLAAFCILFGLTGLAVCGLILLSRVSDALAELDANSWR